MNGKGSKWPQTDMKRYWESDYWKRRDERKQAPVKDCLTAGVDSGEPGVDSGEREISG